MKRSSLRRLLIPAALLTLLMIGLTSASAQQIDHELFPPLGPLTNITFGASLPSSVFRTVAVPSGGADVDIFARDCCIRDDVVEIYVDDCLLAIVDSRSGPFGSHPGETHTVSLTEGDHTVEYRNVLSSVGPSGWQVSETLKAFTGAFKCGACEVPGGGAPISETISGFPSCGPAGVLTPKWGSFGSKQILEADSGEMLRLECVSAAVNWYGLFYTPAGGSALRVGVCPFEAGCNSASFFHAGDSDSNGRPDCFISTRWLSKDYGKNDNPNPWTGEPSEDKLDWAESVFDANSNNLTKVAYKFEYASGPPVRGCPARPKPEGMLVQTTTIDPPLGEETEAFFDEVIDALQELPPGDPMEADSSLPCDLDGDGDCDEDDFELFEGARGACRGDALYRPEADADGDGCVTTTDQEALFRLLIDIKPGSLPNSVNPRSRGLVPVAVLATPFSADPSSIDTATILFGSTGSEAAPLRIGSEDVDDDGDIDMILHFRVAETGISCGETSAYLRALTTDGEALAAVDSIKTAGCGSLGQRSGSTSLRVGIDRRGKEGKELRREHRRRLREERDRRVKNEASKLGQVLD